MITLLMVILFSISCTHKLARGTASLSSEHLVSKYEEESARYALSYEPKRLGSFEDLTKIENSEKFYLLLGQIDLGKVKPIRSRLLIHGKDFRDLINLDGVSQISYVQWKGLARDISRAYEDGDYVFRKGSNFYTLSGLKLNIKNIVKRAFLRAGKYTEDLNKEDFALSVFNKRSLYRLSTEMSLHLPTLIYIENRRLDHIGQDFVRQVGKGIRVSPTELFNYNYKKGLSLNGPYEIYRTEKYESFIGDHTLGNPEKACRTKFYFRSLSGNREAHKYIETLIEHKPKLMKELKLTDGVYNELMVLSLGILAVESKMGRSLKYALKEKVKIGNRNLGQMAIKYLKKRRGRTDDNSRGLTQIKDISRLLKNTSYKYLAQSNLSKPENAALATLFVLKEKLGHLNHFKKLHSNITDFNWVDYLYYFYQGSSRQITKGTATPPLNLRIKKILEIKNRSIVFIDCD